MTNSAFRAVPSKLSTTRRSLSQDSVLRAAQTVEKAKATKRTIPTKKGSSHADVIDRMDFSGVGPSTSQVALRGVHMLTMLLCRYYSSVPSRRSLRCLRAIPQQAPDQSAHACMDERDRRR